MISCIFGTDSFKNADPVAKTIFDETAKRTRERRSNFVDFVVSSNYVEMTKYCSAVAARRDLYRIIKDRAPRVDSVSAADIRRLVELTRQIIQSKG